MHPPSIYRIKILAYIKSIIPTSGFQEQIVKWICKVSIWFMKWTCLFCNWGNVSNHKISSVLCKLDMMSDNYQSCVNPNQVGEGQRGCCIRSPLATKLLHGVLFPEDITQQDLKNLALGIYVIKAYTKFQHCRCITFEALNIFHFSWSDFVSCSKKLCTTQIPCNNDNN